MARFSGRQAAATLERAFALTARHPPDKRVEVEVELLEDLARVYAGSLDARAADTYARLAETASRAGRLDVECRALLGLGFTLARTEFDRSMALLSVAVTKSAALEDPIARARIRTFGHGWRSWAAGWSEEDAQACKTALEEIRSSGDIVALNASYVDYSLLVFTSSRYQEARDLIGTCFDVLVAKGLDQRADISLPLWILRLGRPGPFFMPACSVKRSRCFIRASRISSAMAMLVGRQHSSSTTLSVISISTTMSGRSSSATAHWSSPSVKPPLLFAVDRPTPTMSPLRILRSCCSSPAKARISSILVAWSVAPQSGMNAFSRRDLAVGREGHVGQAC